MKKMSRKLVMMIILTTMVFAVAISIGVYAIISSTSTRGNIEITTEEINATTSYSSSTNSFSWTFEEAGDAKTVVIATTNQSGAVLHSIYNVTSTGDTNLLNAILVYFNDEYIGTLSELNTVPLDIEDKYSFIPLSNSVSDNLKFELHQAAASSIFDGKSVTITITSIIQNADYLDYIFVTNEDEFKRAVDDVNSGLFSVTPTIILCNALNLQNSYTLKNPTKIYLNGKTLNGSLTINDDNTTSPDAVLEVLGDGTFNANVTVGDYYDEAAALALFVEHAKEALGESVAAGSTTDIIGYYSFYEFGVTVGSNCTFTSPNVIIPNTTSEYYSKVASIEVEDQVIEFKVVGSMSALIDATLAHLPSTGENVTADLFLPTYIKDENSAITWKSSNEDVMSSEGKIASTRLDNEEITLYAEIKINDTVVSRTFNFTVSAHNNEINFYKLVQEISPIVIANVYTSEADADDALYYLPIVSANSNGTFNSYDYRTSYVSPVNTQLFNWVAYNDIGLESLTYSMTEEQIAAYEYITQSGNNLYLNKTTLNNFARINVTGDFGNDETYTTYINISISVGSNTQLLEKAFAQITEELSEISVLGNILSTRISNGMANEKGDFSLNSVYLEDDDYTIEYSGADTIISSITYNSDTGLYDFAINPEYFNEYETTVAFKATVYYKKGVEGTETSKSRTFYITVPAALHVDDFGTISLYNSLKYQTYLALPSNERSGTSGYTISNSVLYDSNINYVLLRDIVGDSSYLLEYNDNDDLYLDIISYTSTSQYATGVKSIYLNTNSVNNTNTTDTAAYDMARLIQWATNNQRVAASTVISSQTLSGIGSTLGAIKSNAEDYVNNNELSVLKACYKYYTGASDSEWETIYSEIFNESPGYIYTNPDLLNAVISALGNNSISFTSENFANLFGKYMEILQRYAVSTTKVNENDVAPCQEQYNKSYVWYPSETSVTSFTAYNYSNNNTYTFSSYTYQIQLKNGMYWYRAPWQGNGGSGGDGNLTGYYATTDFAADRTSYITPAEFQVVVMFWLNACGNNLSTTVSDTNITAIQKVLTNDNGTYYSNYSITDFTYIGQAILNGFYACMEIPTYFSTDGVSKLVKYFYDNYNYNSTSYELSTYDESVQTTFKSTLNNASVPYVTNVDNLKNTLSYFINVEELNVTGNSSLYAFLSENGLFTFYTRTSLDNTLINKLVMNYCAYDGVNFDLSSISNFDNLTYLDLSYNTGIQSVNELVNVNRGNYAYVDISNIGIDYDYQEFAIDNIATPSCTVYYTDNNGNKVYSNDDTYASVIADLTDFNKFITKYMYMSNIIYNDDGTTTTVNWRIEEGNPIVTTISADGTYPTITSVSDMNDFISPYYYATETFAYTYNNTTFTFIKGYVYKIYCVVTTDGITFSRNTIGGPYDSASDISNLENYVDTTIPDLSSETPTETYTYSTPEVITEGSYSYDSYQSLLTDGSSRPTTSGTFTKNYYTRDSSNQTFSLTLPTAQNIETYILAQLSNYSNVTITSYSTIVTVKSFNNNGSTSISDSWQHGLFLNNSLYSYSNILVGGQNSYTFNTFNLSSYYGLNATIKYYNAGTRSLFGYTFGRYMYPDYTNYSWNTYKNQCFYSIDLEISYTATYGDTSNILILYNSGDSQSLQGYEACGYRVKKQENVTINYTQTESTISKYYDKAGTYLYYNGSATSVLDPDGNSISIKEGTLIYICPRYVYTQETRSRTYQIVGDIYTWEFYYIQNVNDYNNFAQSPLTYDFNSDLEYGLGGTIDGSLIYAIVINTTNITMGTDIEKSLPGYSSELENGDYYLPVGEYTVTEGEGFDDDWSVPLVSTWTYYNTYAYPFIDYVDEFSSSQHNRLDTQLMIYENLEEEIYYIVRYTGTTGSENIYIESKTSTTSDQFYNSYAYNVTINSSNRLSWNQYATFVTDGSGTTMYSILTTANKHFGDNQYGAYYGMYYGYSGATMYDANLGMYLKHYTVYRIMPNSANTAFEWVEVQQYVVDTSNNILLALGTGSANTGDIFYSTATAGFGYFYGSQWYKIVVDEKTHIVNLVRFNDLAISINSNYTRLTNSKYVARSGDYLGFSGTFTVEISAVYRVKNSDGSYTDYVKTYKLRFVGSLTS